MTHALVEFEEEACTAVVPLNHVIGLKNSVKGEVISVLWNNKKEYLGRFIVSGMATFVAYDDWGGGGTRSIRPRVSQKQFREWAILSKIFLEKLSW